MTQAKNIIVVGGGGFCGRPTALHLSRLGHNITIVDNMPRRDIDTEMPDTDRIHGRSSGGMERTDGPDNRV